MAAFTTKLMQVTLGLFALTQGWALHESDLLEDIILNDQTETTEPCRLVPCEPKCRDAPKDSTFEQLKFRAPAVVVPGNSTYRLCTQDQDCLDKNARCEASILRQQELEAAKIAKAGERYNAAMGSVGGAVGAVAKTPTRLAPFTMSKFKMAGCADTPDAQVFAHFGWKLPKCAAGKEYCHHWQYGAVLRKLCPKTCGECPVQAPAAPATAPARCADDDEGVKRESNGKATSCAAVASSCNDVKVGWVRVHCRKTCGECSIFDDCIDTPEVGLIFLDFVEGFTEGKWRNACEHQANSPLWKGGKFTTCADVKSAQMCDLMVTKVHDVAIRVHDLCPVTCNTCPKSVEKDKECIQIAKEYHEIAGGSCFWCSQNEKRRIAQFMVFATQIAIKHTKDFAHGDLKCSDKATAVALGRGADLLRAAFKLDCCYRKKQNPLSFYPWCGCVDLQAGCSAAKGLFAAKDYCSDSDYGPFVRGVCPRTCGKCCTDTPDAQMFAHFGFKLPTCAAGKQYCHHWQHGADLRKLCPKTCDVCMCAPRSAFCAVAPGIAVDNVDLQDVSQLQDALAGKASTRMVWAPENPDTPTPSHSPVNGPADGNVCLF